MSIRRSISGAGMCCVVITALITLRAFTLTPANPALKPFELIFHRNAIKKRLQSFYSAEQGLVREYGLSWVCSKSHVVYDLRTWPPDTFAPLEEDGPGAEPAELSFSSVPVLFSRGRSQKRLQSFCSPGPQLSAHVWFVYLFLSCAVGYRGQSMLPRRSASQAFMSRTPRPKFCFLFLPRLRQLVAFLPAWYVGSSLCYPV